MSPLLVVCGLVWSEGLFLGARKKAGKTNAGLWELPGGKIGKNERPEQALVREFQEELGMPLLVGRLLGRVKQEGAVHLELIAFEARCTTNQPKHSCDHDSVAWVSPEYWEVLTWCDNDARLLKQILSC